jgi:hypothetical protein
LTHCSTGWEGRRRRTLCIQERKRVVRLSWRSIVLSATFGLWLRAAAAAAAEVRSSAVSRRSLASS